MANPPTLPVFVSPFRLSYLVKDAIIQSDALDQQEIYRRLGLLLEALGMAPARDPAAPFLMEAAPSLLTLKEQPYDTLFSRPWSLSGRQAEERGRKLWERWLDRIPSELMVPGAPQEVSQRLTKGLEKPLLDAGLYSLWIPAVAALVQGLILLTAQKAMQKKEPLPR